MNTMSHFHGFFHPSTTWLLNPYFLHWFCFEIVKSAKKFILWYFQNYLGDKNCVNIVNIIKGSTWTFFSLTLNMVFFCHLRLLCVTMPVKKGTRALALTHPLAQLLAFDLKIAEKTESSSNRWVFTRHSPIHNGHHFPKLVWPTSHPSVEKLSTQTFAQTTDSMIYQELNFMSEQLTKISFF